MIDDLTSTEIFKGTMAIITGGAFVGWFREHRRAKKDAYNFAIELLKQQSVELASERARVDKLVEDMAIVKAQHNIATDALEVLRKENVELKAECIILQKKLQEYHDEKI